MDGPDPVRELPVGGGPRRPGRGGGIPGVARGPVDLEDLTQPLHLEGVSVVGDELKAAHQFVSPAKYLAAWRRTDFSVSIFAFSARSWAFSASSRATLSAWVSGRLNGLCRLLIGAVVEPVPNVLTHSDKVPREIPRSSAMPRNVAPGVDSYRSTACRRNSSV